MATVMGQCNYAENPEYLRNLLTQVSVMKMMHQIIEASKYLEEWWNYVQHMFCLDKIMNSTKDLATAWMEQMEHVNHCWYLINSFDLPKNMHSKQYWGLAELRLLIKESLQLLASLKNGMTMNQILQHILLWSLMMMTSCYPGLFLKTSHYLDEWLKFSNSTVESIQCLGNYLPLERRTHQLILYGNIHHQRYNA
ncbi:hypothetical protein ARMGADRAFT_1036287 [Armillaria gallica]|uniref:Uncharacterized protein n=1 Tax=Armillaria gallica TaxID=47427 RepID=A0A2H3CR72_ARMGA|nr:hypothetical protein ARMGADRAFT_1036287 [Armillaria gallica]